MLARRRSAYEASLNGKAHKNQQLEVATNGGPTSAILALPYTIGLWQETKPVLIAMSQGMNALHFTGSKDNMGLTIKQFTLWPVKQGWF